jgi:hypothetical protein
MVNTCESRATYTTPAQDGIHKHRGAKTMFNLGKIVKKKVRIEQSMERMVRF